MQSMSVEEAVNNSQAAFLDVKCIDDNVESLMQFCITLRAQNFI